VGKSRSKNAVFNSITLCLVEVPWWLATLALVCFGPLVEFYGYAAALLLTGSIIAMTITAYFSSWRGSIWIPQDVPVAILAIITLDIISSASAETPAKELFVTIVALIALSSFATGILFFTLGQLRLGNLVRYLPFPVIAGFLGGTGWLLMKAGADVAIGDQVTSGYWQPDTLLRWAPGALLAFAAWWLGRRYDHPLLLPGLMLLAALAFHGLLLLTGWSLENVNATGWMFNALSPDTQSSALQLSDFSAVNGSVLLEHSGSILVLAVGCVISMLLNNSGFELQVGKDFDLNKDLRVAGIASVLGGMFGGWPGYMSPASSLINARQGQQLPITGRLVPVGVLVIVWAAIPLLSLLPLFVISSAVTYIGIFFIADWVFASYRRLSLGEYLVVLGIVASIALFGLAQGVIVGMLLAVALFLVTFSRIEVVRQQLTGEHALSRVKRNIQERAHLLSNGRKIQIFQLQGYLFFGTANQLLERIRSTTIRKETQFVVLDFLHVSGVDSTATSSFLKVQRGAANEELKPVFSGLDETSQLTIQQQFKYANAELPRFFPNRDLALEWIEEQQLINAPNDDNSVSPTLKGFLKSIANDADIDRIFELLEPCEFKAGDYLIKQGDTASEMFFINKGSVTLLFDQTDGSHFRLETLSHCVVGELAFYLGNRRSASVVCDDNCSIFKLTHKRLEDIEQQHPKVASTIHFILAKLLSERTSHLVAQVAALEK
jgi:SulP family sulfate permease